ncbi:MAG: thiamine pyrophosphate-requiring protein, partial [Gammaproteobacteria bacterium]|nr:thiamine pyrophosphate-requiring protein [Gammaproteobacteria bacterium]
MSFQPENAAEALLARLATHGVDTLFANGGTDFASIIEAYARATPLGARFPEPLVMPHETAAVAMAHGRYLATGQPQAVMAHVTVGLANTVMGVINAAADNVPLILMAGRTPITEGARLGARNVPIHWGQDLRDPASMVRSAVKWEYELRYADEVEAVVDRAIAIAMSEPRGPVYLALPREPLAEPLTRSGPAPAPRATVASPLLADTPALETAAEWLGSARHPVVISGRGDPEGQTAAALTRLAEHLSIPVLEFWPTRNVLATDHPLHAGFEPTPWLAQADVVLVLDNLVPWIANQVQLPQHCRVIQLGADPLFGRFPMRGFAVDLALAGNPGSTLRSLLELVGPARPRDPALEARIAEDRKSRAQRASEASTPMTPAFVSGCVSTAIGPEAIIVNELGLQAPYVTVGGPNQFFGHSLSAGLGWGLPAALGIAHAERSRLVAACIGDGSYMFA